MDTGLRKDDYLLLAWDGGPGGLIWLIKREEILYFYSIIGNRFIVVHFAYRNASQIDDLRRPFLLMGFAEKPVYSTKIPSDVRDRIETEIQNYEKRLKEEGDPNHKKIEVVKN